MFLPLVGLLPLAFDNPPTPPPGFDKFLSALAWVRWLGFGFALIALIVFALRLVKQHHHGEPVQLDGLGVVLLAIVIIAAAPGIVSFFM